MSIPLREAPGYVNYLFEVMPENTRYVEARNHLISATRHISLALAFDDQRVASSRVVYGPGERVAA